MSATVCYRCNRSGHFARDCSQQAVVRALKAREADGKNATSATDSATLQGNARRKTGVTGAAASATSPKTARRARMSRRATAVTRLDTSLATAPRATHAATSPLATTATSPDTLRATVRRAGRPATCAESPATSAGTAKRRMGESVLAKIHKFVVLFV
jgi:hypothetical protein